MNPSSDMPQEDDLTYEEVTHNIRVAVAPSFMEDQSEPAEGRFIWSYRVTIENRRAETVQLVARHWRITDAHGRVREVRGPGVVGEQPTLAPGRSFEYTSFCPLKTSVGAMQGSYQMVTADGEKFDAAIAPFTLAVPNAVN